jgi:trigger factor
MQVSVEATGGLERRMTVQVPEEKITKAVEGRLKQLAKTTKIKGFRPGKVPMKVIQQRYGDQARYEVMGDVMQSTFYEAISQEKLNPAGAPQMEPKLDSEGDTFEYTATFEVMPEITPSGLDGVAIEKVTSEVTDADLDAMLENLRKQHTGWEEVERAAAEGDRLNIDFTGTIDGNEFPGNSGQQVPVTLGGKRMIPGFEEGLVGAKAGDEITLDLTFPEDYGNKDVAGKAAQFQVKVNKVEAPKLPELDEEFVKGFGIGDGSVESLKAEVRKNMEMELEQNLHNQVKQQVMDKLLERNEIDVPQALVERESQAMMQQMQQQMHIPEGKSGVDLDPSMFNESATRRVKLGLLIAEVIKANDIKADADKVRAQVEALASTYEEPEEVINWYYADKSRLAQVESLVLEDAVVDWALNQADVSETAKPFDELMNRS